jgi:hypothetical protein
MAYVWVATALVEERSATSKLAASTSSRHLRNRSNRPTHKKLPTIQEEVNQPRANAAPGVDLRANLNKNRVGDSPRGPLKQWGKPHLKPATKPKNVKSNHAGA